MCGGVHYGEVEGLVSVERWLCPAPQNETRHQMLFPVRTCPTVRVGQ